MMVVAPVAPPVVDQFDFRLAAIVGDIRRRSFQFVEDAARVRHAGNSVDRPDGRRHGGGAGEAENPCKE